MQESGVQESGFAEWCGGGFSQTVEFLSFALAVRSEALVWRRRVLSSELLNSCLQRSALREKKPYVRV
jgi:hypothetical protein